MLNEFICIGLICIAAKSFYEAFTDKDKHIDLDHYPVLDYVITEAEDKKTQDHVNNNINKKIVKTEKRQPTPKAKTKLEEHKVNASDAQPRNYNGYTALQQDCFDALKSLGVKTKQERMFIVNTTFNKYNPKSIQEFLYIALRK
jgi:hypothetical protein